MKQTVIFVASLYSHFRAFHLPYIRLLQGWGYEVWCAASGRDRRQQDAKNYIEALGVRCWDVPFCRSPYAAGNLAALAALNRLFRSHYFNLVHVHTPVAAFLTRYVCSLGRQGPVLYTVHGFHFYPGAPLKNWLIYYSAERIAAKWTAGLIVLNHEDFIAATRLGFVPGKNLFKVHGVGVDLMAFDPAQLQSGGGIRTQLGIGAGEIVLTSVGEFNANKNQGFLLDAFEQIAFRNRHLHLLFVGDGRNRQALEKKVVIRGIPRVHFLGYRTDVPHILRDTDIVVLVSKREGLPRSLMEAMAAAKPVIATNIRGCRDLVEHGRTGFLVELGDVRGLAQAMITLAENPRLRSAFGREAYVQIQNYSLDRVMQEMSAVYAKYLEK